MNQLLDRVATQDLIARYFYGMDTGDADSVTSLFTPDPSASTSLEKMG